MANTLVGLSRPLSHPAHDAPEVPPGLAASAVIGLVDVLFGRDGSFPKFRALELIARVMYQAWESVAYREITSAYPDRALTAALHARVESARREQDHEHRHLVMMEELCARRGEREHQILHIAIPQLLAHVLYGLAWLSHALFPAWSYHLNAELEDRAEREYLRFVAMHPELEHEPSGFAAGQTLAEMFREMASEERQHKVESLARCAAMKAGVRTA
jgi:hypothetical protein